MILTLTGENTFAIAQAERQLINAFAAKHGANGIERIDAEGLEPNRLPDLLQGSTLFAPARLVLLRKIANNKVIQEALLTGLAQIPADNTIVISDSALDKRTKLYKFLKTHSTFKDFMLPKERELLEWLQRQAVDFGAQLNTQDAAYLLSKAGTDQWRLANELDKLAAYQPVITRLAIDQLVDPITEGTAFDALDATLAGRDSEAAILLSSLRYQEDPYRFFGLLTSQIHTLAVVAAAGSRGADDIAKHAGLHPFVVRKTQSLARRLTTPQVAYMARVVARCDVQLKTTGADPWDLIAMCVRRLVPKTAP